MSLREVPGPAGGRFEPPPDLPDEALVASFQQDPESASGRAAVSRLLGRYRKLVMVWCWRYFSDRETVLDLAQDILLNAFRNLPEYHEQQKFSAWLFIIARNRCLSELRRRKIPQAGEAVLDLLADPGLDPAAVLDVKRTGETLRQLVADTLTEMERDALWMRCFEVMSVDEITRNLGITEASGARAVLQRARRKLRPALDDREQIRKGGEQ